MRFASQCMRTSKTPTPIAAPSNEAAAPLTLLTKAELCVLLRISQRTLEGMVAAGEFPPGVRIGRFMYWTDSVVPVWAARMFGEQQAWQPF